MQPIPQGHVEIPSTDFHSIYKVYEWNRYNLKRTNEPMIGERGVTRAGLGGECILAPPPRRLNYICNPSRYESAPNMVIKGWVSINQGAVETGGNNLGG